MIFKRRPENLITLQNIRIAQSKRGLKYLNVGTGFCALPHVTKMTADYLD